MRNLLAFLAVIVISFCTACYYRGWCYVESLPAEPGHTAFRVEIDRLRIAKDVMDGARAIQRALATEQREGEKAAEGDKSQPSPLLRESSVKAKE